MANPGLQLLVGLGNPGKKYTNNRHNTGFWWIDKIAAKTNAELREQAKFHGLLAQIAWEQQKIHLLKPTTYMNRSGLAVQAFAHFYSIPAEQILIAHDDLDLPCGTIKLKFAGGHGGHNGLRDLIQQIGADFWRLRIGIGHPGHRDQVLNYVLGDASAAEYQDITAALANSLQVLPQMLSGNMASAMQFLHSKPTSE